MKKQLFERKTKTGLMRVKNTFLKQSNQADKLCSIDKHQKRKILQSLLGTHHTFRKIK